MDYGKRGVHLRKKELNTVGSKLSRKVVLWIGLAVFVAIVAGCVFAAGLAYGAFMSILADTPTVKLSDVVAVGEATIVYDNQGNEIDQYVSESSNRIIVSAEEITPYLGLAFVAIEDERFYTHNGIDYKGILRAGWTYFQSGFSETQGASTITQQLLKNTVFTSWTEEGNNLIKKIKRKIQEQYLALEVTKSFEKDEILVRYMNVINLGQNTLGVEAAAQRYFGKSALDLTISECAVIACITQNPTGYNPISHPDNNARRRQDCLDKMLELGFITQAQYDEAVADTDDVYLRIAAYNESYTTSTTTTSGSYFSDAVYEQVREDLVSIAGYTESMAESLLLSGGLKIYSTMDPEIQAIADEEFENPDNWPTYTKWYVSTYALTITDDEGENHNFSKENFQTWYQSNVSKSFNLIFDSTDAAYEGLDLYKAAMFAELGLEETEENVTESISITAQPQAAIVIEDQTTGYVVAMVGGRGTKEGRRTLNRATSAGSSPGSTFKVLASFAPALDSAGMTLATVYLDAAFNYNDGTAVKNWYTTGYRGICSIRDAITQSLNIIAVKNITVITPQLGYDYLINFGITTLTDGVATSSGVLTDVNQSLALGGVTYGVSPYELNAAYAAIANGGVYVTPKLYTQVVDSDGNVVLDNTEPTSRRVIKETTAYLLTSAMQDVLSSSSGTGGAAKFSGQAIAGKTGTTSNNVDVWFVGYTPYYTATVWSGYDNNVSMVSSGNDKETNTAKYLFKSIMSRIHEDLEYKDFEKPDGIVSVTICTQSGKLPIEGVCDSCLKTEYFAEGTQPTETCDVHYSGPVCAYDGLPASSECPFKTTGILTLDLIEDSSLISGSTVITENEDGTTTMTTPATSITYCQHNAEFYLQANAEELIAAQQAQLTAAQQAALEAEAAAAAESEEPLG